MAAANKVMIGGFSIETIQQKARAAGNEQLANQLGSLSLESIRLLVEIGRSELIVVGEGPSSPESPLTFSMNTKELEAVKELAENGLVEYHEDINRFLEWLNSGLFRQVHQIGPEEREVFGPTRKLSDEELKRLYDQHFKLSSAGAQAWEAIVSVVIDQLKTS
ncbi:hypothetical protein IQ256_28860 [cf. Phormidesmis sp. LEGE 11477]|nr:hypothetical protein [cf. Phormidesmis sp. LEGE 11477]